MTLIITLLTSNKVVQASDRRLTGQDGGILDDEANKAVCVGCKDAHFCIVYTGLAYIGRKRTDEWLVDYLVSIHAYQMDVASISAGMEEQLTVSLAQLPIPKRYKRTTVVLSGYRHHMPFMMITSNFERENLWPQGEAQDSFRTHVWWMSKKGRPEDACCLSINGMQQAVIRPVLRKIKGLRRTRFFQKKGTEIVADELVSLIRAAADTPQLGQYIGRNCMAVTVTPNPADGFATKYYPEKTSPYQYSPHLITAPGIAIKGIEIWRGKGQPPWQRTPYK